MADEQNIPATTLVPATVISPFLFTVYRTPTGEWACRQRVQVPQSNPTQFEGVFEEEYQAGPAWAGPGPCLVKSEAELLELGLNRISGWFDCPVCEKSFPFGVPLHNHRGIGAYIERKRSTLKKRAPPAWMKPITPLCPSCEESCVHYKPATEERRINWLFLHLNGALGVLTKKELQYFCGHRNLNKSGTKDILLYSVIVDIEEQLSYVPPAAVDLVDGA